MTERHQSYVHTETIKILKGNLSGLCVPLGILRTIKREVPEEQLIKITEKIIETFQRQETDLEKFWLGWSRIFYPKIKWDDLETKFPDDISSELIDHIYKYKRPTLFLIDYPDGRSHAIPIGIQKTPRHLHIKMLEGYDGRYPTIDAATGKILLDFDGLAGRFMSPSSEIVVFPPEEQMKFD